MERTESDDTGEQDPFGDLPEIETIAVNQGFIPEGLLFWRRKKRTAAA